MPRPQVSEELVGELDERVATLVRVDVNDLTFTQKMELVLEEYDDLLASDHGADS